MAAALSTHSAFPSSKVSLPAPGTAPSHFLSPSFTAGSSSLLPLKSSPPPGFPLPLASPHPIPGSARVPLCPTKTLMLSKHISPNQTSLPNLGPRGHLPLVISLRPLSARCQGPSREAVAGLAFCPSTDFSVFFLPTSPSQTHFSPASASARRVTVNSLLLCALKDSRPERTCGPHAPLLLLLLLLSRSVVSTSV